MPDGSRRVLAAAILHEGEIPDARLAELAANPTDVDPLVAGGWLRKTKSGHWLSALDVTALETLASWSLLRVAHLALARILERNPAQGVQAAAHFSACGRPAEAGRVLLATARLHSRRHQHRSAAHCFAEAIRLLPDDTPEAELVAAVRDFGVCAGLQRDSAEAIELLQLWRQRPTWSAHHAFQGHAGRVLADILTHRGWHVEGAQIRRGAAQHFLHAGREGEAAGELLAAASALVRALHTTAARDAATAAVIQARIAERPDLEAQALAVQGRTLGMLGDTRQSNALLEAALEMAIAHRLTGVAAEIYRLMGKMNDYASCYDDQSAFRRAIAFCARNDHTGIADVCRSCLSYALYRRGRWKEGLRIARQVSEKKGGPEGSRAAGTLVHGLIRIMRGESRPGMALVEKGRHLGRQTGNGAIEIFAWTALAAAHEANSRTTEAVFCYRQLMEYWLTTDDRHDVVPGFCAAVTFFSRQGDRAQAAEFAAPLQSIATTTPTREAQGAAHYAAAELKLLDRDPAAAVEAFGQALAAFAEHNCAIEVIRTRIRLASAQLAAGELATATALLREARAQATRLGCRPLAALAASSMPKAANRKEPGPDPLLSPRQGDVARQLSAGCTNKEIAHVLGLSVRTVDMHVAHVLARLDCRTRTEAAAKLAELGLR